MCRRRFGPRLSLAGEGSSVLRAGAWALRPGPGTAWPSLPAWAPRVSLGGCPAPSRPGSGENQDTHDGRPRALQGCCPRVTIGTAKPGQVPSVATAGQHWLSPGDRTSLLPKVAYRWRSPQEAGALVTGVKSLHSFSALSAGGWGHYRFLLMSMVTQVMLGCGLTPPIRHPWLRAFRLRLHLGSKNWTQFCPAPRNSDQNASIGKRPRKVPGRLPPGGVPGTNGTRLQPVKSPTRPLSRPFKEARGLPSQTPEQAPGPPCGSHFQVGLWG